MANKYDCSDNPQELDGIIGSLIYTDDVTSFSGLRTVATSIGTGSPISCNTAYDWLKLFKQAIELSGSAPALRVVTTAKSGGAGISSAVSCGVPVNISKLFSMSFVYDVNDDIALHIFNVA